MSDWYVRSGGKVHGPVNSARLKQFADEGKIRPSTAVSRSKDGPWSEAGKVAGLFSDSPIGGPAAESSKPVATVSIASDAVPQNSSQLEQAVNRGRIRGYFEQVPIGCAYAAVAFGILTLAVSLTKDNALGGIIVAVFSGIVAALVVKKRKEAAAEADFDTWLEADLRNIAKLSLSKVGLQRDSLIRDPLVVTGPALMKVKDVAKHSRSGRDDLLRFTPVAVTVVHLTKDQLIAYTCLLDLLTGTSHAESTEEFFYKDIVSVTTKKESKKINVDGTDMQMNAAETFTVATSGGTALSVFLTDPDLVVKMGGGRIPRDRAEAAIEAIRAIVRERKEGRAV